MLSALSIHRALCIPRTLSSPQFGRESMKAAGGIAPHFAADAASCAGTFEAIAASCDSSLAASVFTPAAMHISQVNEGLMAV